LARRDPLVQARCLGLAKLGFFVLAIDAFGAGERYTQRGPGTYHGALYGSTLWPAGQTLCGMQVFDNRRAVDYLLSRPEVDGNRIGITGASGGGNQSMYAGALDERLRAVVPVCSVGNYLVYLRTACCVCEVVPGALRFTEEGDVLGLVAPRALFVISASRDAVQFSPAEAEKSLSRARIIFGLCHATERLRHQVFDSGHDYNQPMREAMYGWMKQWLQNEGDGRPITETAQTIEKPEDLSCYADQPRPKGFLFPPSYAYREARALLSRFDERRPDHAEDWESSAAYMRAQLQKQVVGEMPRAMVSAQIGMPETNDGISTVPLVLYPEADMPLPARLKTMRAAKTKQSAWILLDLDGKDEALKQPLATSLLNKDCAVLAPDLRATGETRPDHDAVADAHDHNSAEHAIWIGRPLLGLWVIDVCACADWLALQPGVERRRIGIVGFGAAGIVALLAAGLEDRFEAVLVLDSPATYATEQAYGRKMRMGLLAPGILRIADIPQLASLIAPRRLVIAGGAGPQDTLLKHQELRRAFAFTTTIYKVLHADAKLTIPPQAGAEEIAALIAK
jgi:dienelactone hydrolase